jgi:hypothetical protein
MTHLALTVRLETWNQSHTESLVLNMGCYSKYQMRRDETPRGELTIHVPRHWRDRVTNLL